MKKRIFLRVMQIIGMIVTFFVAIAASGAAIDADLSWAWRFIAFFVMVIFMSIFIIISSAEIPYGRDKKG